MTKFFDLIHTEGNILLVDKEAEVNYDDVFYCDGSITTKHLNFNESKRDWVKVLAMTKDYSNYQVPQLVMPDEIKTSWLKIIDGNKNISPTNPFYMACHDNFIRGWNANPCKYSEEQVLTILNKLANDIIHKKEIGGASYGSMSVYYPYLSKWLKSLSTRPTQAEIEIFHFEKGLGENSVVYRIYIPKVVDNKITVISVK